LVVRLRLDCDKSGGKIHLRAPNENASPYEERFAVLVLPHDEVASSRPRVTIVGPVASENPIRWDSRDGDKS
jgi:hypothetical protein